jgi:hypothetical protein
MHATMRYYHGNPGLADQLAARADEVRALLRAVSGFQAYYLVRLDDATVSITISDDEAGAEESTQVAAGWIRENMPELAASPPLVSSGTVTVSA